MSSAIHITMHHFHDFVLSISLVLFRILQLLLLLGPDKSLVKMLCLAGLGCLAVEVFCFFFFVPLLPEPVAFNLLLLLPAGVLESNRSWLSLMVSVIARTTQSTSWLLILVSRWFVMVFIYTFNGEVPIF